MAQFVTFGEIMLRLKTTGHERFFQSPAFEATFGGGDSFASALIYGLTAYDDQHEALGFAVAPTFLRHLSCCSVLACLLLSVTSSISPRV